MSTPPETSAPARRPTLEQVALEAGVTRSTVSRVVNGEPDVSAATVETVRAAIARLGYVPNRAARSLASQRSMAIALIVPERVELFVDDPHLTAIMAGVSRRIEASEFVLNLVVSSGDPQGKLVRYLGSGAVDGALVASQHSRHEYLAHLRERLPVVFGGQPSHLTDPPNHVVDIDNRGAARNAVEHLIGRGRRRIGTITGALDMSAARDRLDGWTDALAAAGLPSDAIAPADFTAAGAVAATRALLAAHPDVDAIFVASDVMANAAIGVLHELALRVPQDVAVVGFDDSVAATAGPVPLTTVRQESLEMGARMAANLLDLIAGREVERTTLMPTRLVVRESA